VRRLDAAFDATHRLVTAMKIADGTFRLAPYQPRGVVVFVPMPSSHGIRHPQVGFHPGRPARP
jgi:hypothetical protein